MKFLFFISFLLFENGSYIVFLKGFIVEIEVCIIELV